MSAELATRLTSMGLSNCNRRQLYRYRDFYRACPVFVGMLSAQLRPLLPAGLLSPKVRDAEAVKKSVLTGMVECWA
jgi:hypothetical protein